MQAQESIFFCRLNFATIGLLLLARQGQAPALQGKTKRIAPPAARERQSREMSRRSGTENFRQKGKRQEKTVGFLSCVSFPYFFAQAKKYGRRRHDQRKVSAMSRFRACGAGKRIAAPSCGMVRNDSCMMQQTRSFVFAILQNARPADKISS